MVTVTVDEDICIGCGVCVEVCEDVFELNENGKSKVKKDADLDCECVHDAADQCPVSAIEVS